MRMQKTSHPYIPYIYLAIALLALGGLGYLGFLTFVRNILMPGEFAAYGLVITTVAAGTASFFSPCSFTVLPSYIAFASSGVSSSCLGGHGVSAYEQKTQQSPSFGRKTAPQMAHS